MKIRILHWKRAVFAVLLTLLLSATGVTNAMAQEFTVGNLNYSVNDDGISVTLTGHVDGESATGTLTIPESVTYEGMAYPVTTIGSWAFYDCSGFTGDLVIPNSVTSIGYWAFYGCSGFNGTLTLSNSLTEINVGTFIGCSGFTGDLVIPNSVEYISGGWGGEGVGAFEGCSGFTS